MKSINFIKRKLEKGAVKTKPTLFKLLLCYFLLAAFIITILSVFPYVMMKNAFSEQIVKSEKRATIEANHKLSFLLNDLEGIADKVYINNAVQSQLSKKNNASVNNESQEIKEIFTDNRPLYKVNNYDAYILGFNGYNYRYSYTANYQMNIRLDGIKDAGWYQALIEQNGKGVLINGLTSYIKGMEDKIIYGRALINVNHNEPMGVLLMVFHKSVINEIYATLTQDEYKQLYILDEFDQQITTNTEESLLATELLEQARENQSLLLVKQGRQVILTDIDNTNWTVVEVLDLEFLMSAAETLRKVILLLGLVMLIVSAATSYLLLNKLYRPIDRLRLAMTEIENGRFDIDFLEDHKQNEISSLNRSMIDMAGALEASFENLYKEQREKRAAEIKMLQAQIKPHFLYNTLTSVRALIRTEQGEAADQMIISLIKLLKTTFDLKEMISIGEELEILRCYGVIYRYRYQHFQLNFKIEDSLLNYLVPKLLLQPLVENAIVHNLDFDSKHLEIIVEIKSMNDRIVIAVLDNGKGIKPEELKCLRDAKDHTLEQSQSIGIKNVNQRIRHCFGNSYGLLIESEEGRGTYIHMEIPKTYV